MKSSTAIEAIKTKDISRTRLAILLGAVLNQDRFKIRGAAQGCAGGIHPAGNHAGLFSVGSVISIRFDNNAIVTHLNWLAVIIESIPGNGVRAGETRDPRDFVEQTFRSFRYVPETGQFRMVFRLAAPQHNGANQFS